MVAWDCLNLEQSYKYFYQKLYVMQFAKWDLGWRSLWNLGLNGVFFRYITRHGRHLWPDRRMDACGSKWSIRRSNPTKERSNNNANCYQVSWVLFVLTSKFSWRISRSLTEYHTVQFEFREVTERILPQVQTTKMGFLRRVHGVTLCDKVRSCEIRRVLNAEPTTSQNREIPATLIRPCGQNVPVKTGESRPAD